MASVRLTSESLPRLNVLVEKPLMTIVPWSPSAARATVPIVLLPPSTTVALTVALTPVSLDEPLIAAAIAIPLAALSDELANELEAVSDVALDEETVTPLILRSPSFSAFKLTAATVSEPVVASVLANEPADKPKYSSALLEPSTRAKSSAPSEAAIVNWLVEVLKLASRPETELI